MSTWFLIVFLGDFNLLLVTQLNLLNQGLVSPYEIDHEVVVVVDSDRCAGF